MPKDFYYLLVADVGGTNSRFELIKVDPTTLDLSEKDMIRKHHVQVQVRLKNEDFERFLDVFDEFIQQCRSQIPDFPGVDAACLAVAGPIKDNSVTLTNLKWVFSATDIETAYNIPNVRLLNDFEANGYGVLALPDHGYHELREGSPQEGAPIAIIGAGTGLGEGFLTQQNGEYVAWSSEGGHVEFAPRDELQIELLQYLQKKFNGRVSVERVVSGKGLVNTYEFLCEKFPDKVHSRYHKEITSVNEGAAVISQCAYDYALARQAIDIFMSAYGSEAGNVCLKFLPYGGLWIAGGIAPKNLAFMVNEEGNHFMCALGDKGRIGNMLSHIPVNVVTSEDVGLKGAHVVAARQLREQIEHPEMFKTKSQLSLEDLENMAKSEAIHSRSSSRSQSRKHIHDDVRDNNGLNTKDLVLVSLVASTVALAMTHFLKKSL